MLDHLQFANNEEHKTRVIYGKNYL